MPQSLAQIPAQLVVSTKNQEPVLADDIRDEKTPSTSMNAMCGTDLHLAPSGLGAFSAFEPRALPWAVASRRVAAKHRFIQMSAI
jgi:hypothetical protein